MNLEDPAVLKSLMDRLDALEAKTAADALALEAKTADNVSEIVHNVSEIADHILASLAKVQQSVDAGVVASANAIQELLLLLRRIEGAKLTVTLGPEQI